MIRYLEKELHYLEEKEQYLTHIVETSHCPKCDKKKKKCEKKEKEDYKENRGMWMQKVNQIN